MPTKRHKRLYLAKTLAGDWWWDEDYQVVTVNGHVRWDAAFMRSNSRRVRLSRLDPVKLRGVISYVHPDTIMKLVKK